MSLKEQMDKHRHENENGTISITVFKGDNIPEPDKAKHGHDIEVKINNLSNSEVIACMGAMLNSIYRQSEHSYPDLVKICSNHLIESDPNIQAMIRAKIDKENGLPKGMNSHFEKQMEDPEFRNMMEDLKENLDKNPQLKDIIDLLKKSMR